MSPSTKEKVFFSSYLYHERFSVSVVRYRIPIVGLPAAFDGFTILQLSDLHDKEFGRLGKDLLSLLKNEIFHVVAFTGDLVLGPRYRLTPALDLIEGLKRAPVYSVSGNHDWGESGRDWGLGERIKRQLGEAGATVLSNECLPLERAGSRLWLVGLDDPVTGKDRIERATVEIPDAESRVLLVHSPHILPKAVEHKIDLVLAGHTHGGQIRLPGLGALFVPNLGIFPKWDYGFYRSGPTSMVVNGGLGESWVPIRWNIPPEVTLVTLQSSNAQ